MSRWLVILSACVSLADGTPARAGIKDCVQWFKRLVPGSGASISNVDAFEWVGEKPSQTAFTHLMSEAPRWLKEDLRPGQQLIRANTGVLVSRHGGHLLLDGDHVRVSTSLEKALMAASELDHNPHEVMELIGITDRGEMISSGVIDGGGRHVDSGLIYDAIKNVSTQALRREQKLVELHFAHTHPLPQFSYLDRQGLPRMLSFPLSEADLSMGREISRMAGWLPVHIQAVTPEGFTYERLFVSEVDVTKDLIP